MDKYDRQIGETDEQLRQRIIDTPIAKRARTAIWRVFDLPNKDEILYVEGLGSILRMVTFDMKDLKLWPKVILEDEQTSPRLK